MNDRPLQSGPHADEFYVGYLPIPARQRVFLRFAVPAILWLCVAVASLVAARMRDAGPAVWDTSSLRTFTGCLEVSPYPVLRLATQADGGVPGSYLLVEAGKIGGRSGLGPMSGAMVRVKGSLLERDGRRMIELAPGESSVVTVQTTQAAPPVRLAAGRITLRGEIVDSKCYLGAMRPGDGKTHRACAQLCIAGGLPPMLVTRDSQGNASYFLLTTAEGGAANAVVRPHVAEPVEVTGTLERMDDLIFLRVDDGGIRPL